MTAPICVSTIHSSDDFKKTFTKQSEVFLLCYEPVADKISKDSLDAFTAGIRASCAKHSTQIELRLWDCSDASFAAARQQLDKQPGYPLLLIISKGAVADTLRDKTLEAMLAEDMNRVCERIASFQLSKNPATVVTGDHSGGGTGSTMRVDVAKIIGLGKKMLAEGQPVYAEKFFVKAKESLEAVELEVRRGAAPQQLQDFEGSMAMTLAFAGLAQMVQGRIVSENPYVKQLQSGDRYAAFTSEPLSDASRVITCAELMKAAPREWNSDTCSQKKLCAALQQNPADHDSRSMLVITLFLSGDLERCLTEAIKLHTLKVAFGRIALKHIKMFLGENHVLTKLIGTV